MRKACGPGALSRVWEALPGGPGCLPRRGAGHRPPGRAVCRRPHRNRLVARLV